ncbi:ATP-dependent DNA helicase RecG [Patescibacteria group bacterium]|nr:ATP-dependent DNA helicase RecG [Patescibacteria group bacterium]
MEKAKINLKTNISNLHAIAAKLSSSFKKIGVENISDLLWYFPYRYQDLSQISKVSELTVDQNAMILVKIKTIKSYRSWRKKMIITEILASDDSGDIKAVWFGQKFVAQILKKDDWVYLSGKVQKNGLLLQLVSPTYEKLKDEPIHSARLVPIYHLSGDISQKQLRFLIKKSLEDIKEIDDPLPVEILNKEKYPWLYDALREIHFPKDDKSLNNASQRLKFQELLYLQMKYQLAKQDYQKQASYPIPLNDKTVNQTIKNLPFKLTVDQQKALYDILSDLAQKHPMNRLIEGDVGSGKTVLAFLSALNVASYGLQSALMAPTEILAAQHFESAKKILSQKFHTQLALLTRSQTLLADKEISKKELLAKIKRGTVKFVIGTHALIQEKINFCNLALVTIDEQHRFGVKQRKTLKEKNPDDRVPHLLSMTATPIPRTLTLSLYGDLDISIIKEKPAGRQPIKTFVVPEKKRLGAYKFIKEKIAEGQQAFVICPLIDESDKLGSKSVKAEYEKLNDKIFTDLEIRMLHGKLKSAEKEKIMRDFKDNKFPILVATSVIEVGVDIPNATMMIIESAERFGLSQLHQFRGRIGRNDLESFCLLFSDQESTVSKKRLSALTKTNDGFKLAELDLELRGAGDVFGTKQTGLIKLKIAKLSDADLIKKAQKWAQDMLVNKKYSSQNNLQNIIAELKSETHLE